MRYTTKVKDVRIRKGRHVENEHGYIAIPPSQSEFNSMSHEIQKALSKYPKELLTEHIDYVVMFRSLTSVSYFDDEELKYGGTVSQKHVIITLRDGLEYVENIFHHEFNHVLANEHYELFDRERWEDSNPTDFNYHGRYGSSTYIIKHGTSQPWFDTTYLHQGFLSEYSKTKLVEDVARYAEALFLSEQRFWDAFDNYERVRAKARLLIDFYYKLDPIFTEEYFRELENQQGVELE
jgi:hypothetical protein